MSAEIGYAVVAQDTPGGAPHIVTDIGALPDAVGAAARLDSEATLGGRPTHHRAVAVVDLEATDRLHCPDYWATVAALPAGMGPPDVHLRPLPAPVDLDPADPLAVLPRGLVDAVRAGVEDGTLLWFGPGTGGGEAA